MLCLLSPLTPPAQGRGLDLPFLGLTWTLLGIKGFYGHEGSPQGESSMGPSFLECDRRGWQGA